MRPLACNGVRQERFMAVELLAVAWQSYGGESGARGERRREKESYTHVTLHLPSGSVRIGIEGTPLSKSLHPISLQATTVNWYLV